MAAKSQTKAVFQHVALYGQSAKENPDFRGPVPEDFTFNSPVGLCMDRQQHVWVCDTGNNRVLVLDKTLTRIIRVLYAPAPADKGEGKVPFRMPFHVHPHPQKNLVYITDMGNSRVVVMAYEGERIDFEFAFGNREENGGAPLQDPNGVTVVMQRDGGYSIHVNDEFFHTETDKMRNRCVRYDEHGRYVNEFRTLIDPDGTRHDLYWPQGLSSDLEGSLYIANTGSYEILKCPANAPINEHYEMKAEKPVVNHCFGQPTGVGMLNIMRYVGVIGERVFVPDHVLNTISVYSLDGRLESTLAGVRPSWNHGDEPVHSLTDPIYYAMEDAALLNPYVICQGEEDDIFYISEPFSSRVAKLRIPHLDRRFPEAQMIATLGARRDMPGNRRIDPQFNCVTAVTNLLPPANPPVAGKVDAELPDYLKYNPFLQWYEQASQNMQQAYRFWFGDANKLAPAALSGLPLKDLQLTVDAGNWRIKGYREREEDFQAIPGNLVEGYFLAGNLGVAVYHPKVPLFGQLCPGTPLVLVDNFNFGTVTMYQIGPFGHLLNYGIPFGMYGKGDGCMRGPQGMAVSDAGEVFIVDSLNCRIAKWQILPTGLVVFVKNFIWEGEHDQAAFTPTDVALDSQNRVLVTDQFNNRVCCFDRNGKSLWACGREGYWEEGQPDGEKLMLPTSLAVDGDKLILNDLVNRALKLFRIDENGLTFLGGISLFKLHLDQGGVWMPYFMHAHDGQVQIADSTYNVVQVFAY
ncbi:NHL repeat-containing protein [Andreprevotia lacus DSM 23236]|jgi:DNA-binding beta-propeller fold protein YncE|uniref:NHL repeat-containing protein n=1 Tax=Andreprevotia lacus DSM 23236 TaxID=1121001 RepID=A0A1W1XN52_9NEIS|nr:NHL repeat-containing protein [Andreprevotia lacus]SMC25420.1 NHL repeat-containing protein [Andreprevotia lacus DSM 23236]